MNTVTCKVTSRLSFVDRHTGTEIDWPKTDKMMMRWDRELGGAQNV